jgi:hypothetical protein
MLLFQFYPAGTKCHGDIALEALAHFQPSGPHLNLQGIANPLHR